MRAKEKSAEAIVARKAGNAAGAKGRRTKEQARGATDTTPTGFPESRAARSFPPPRKKEGKGNETGSRPTQKRWSRCGQRSVEARASVARLSTESDARRSDGPRGRRAELGAGAGGGQTQPRRGWDRSDDRRRTRSSLAAPRREDAGETRGRAMDAEPRKAGGDPEAERGDASAWHTDGDGSDGTASIAASVATDFRSSIQRVKLRFSSEAQRARRRTSGAERGRETLGAEVSRVSNQPPRAARSGAAKCAAMQAEGARDLAQLP